MTADLDLSQPELISIILKALGKHGVSSLNQRQMNAVVSAANLIYDELRRPDAPAVANSGLFAWLYCDETGLSSRYMARALRTDNMPPVPGESMHNHDVHYPYDPGDFGRCVGLLRAVPELRERLPLLASGHGPQWAALAGAWAELEGLCDEELPTGKAPRLMKRLTELTEGQT